MDFRDIAECELGTPAWKHPDSRVRWDFVQRLDDQELLVEIAKSDSSAVVRAEAALRIRDGDCLKELYGNEKEDFVRRDIVRGIDDETFLIDVVRGGDAGIVRCAAAASRHLKDEDVLEQIALHDPDVRVRRSCVMNANLTDQGILMGVAFAGRDESLRCQTMRKISNERFLEATAITDPSEYVRSAAVANPHLSNEIIMGHVAFNDPSERVRSMAARRITDPVILTELALGDESPRVRREAVENPNLDDEDLIEFVAGNDSDSCVREAAAGNIYLRSESVLIDLAENDSAMSVRMSAIRNPNLKDGDFLEGIARGHPDASFRRNAVMNSNLRSGKLLEYLAQNDEDEKVRADAERKLKVPGLKK